MKHAPDCFLKLKSPLIIPCLSWWMGRGSGTWSSWAWSGFPHHRSRSSPAADDAGTACVPCYVSLWRRSHRGTASSCLSWRWASDHVAGAALACNYWASSWWRWWSAICSSDRPRWRSPVARYVAAPDEEEILHIHTTYNRVMPINCSYFEFNKQHTIHIMNSSILINLNGPNIQYLSNACFNNWFS